MILSQSALKVCSRVMEWSHKNGIMGRAAFTAFGWVVKSHDSLFAANAKLSFENMNLKAENKKLKNELSRVIEFKRRVDDLELF